MDINSKFENIVLVLPGGGTKGAYQAGVIKALRESLDPDYKQVSGVSVGALNGAMVASRQEPELDRIWNMLQEGDMFHRRSLGSLILHLTMWKIGIRKPLTAIYDTSPLKTLVDKYLSDLFIDIPLRVGYVNLVNLSYNLVGFYTNVNDEALKEAVLASASIPVLFPPVNEAQQKTLVDGGLRNISPLGDILQSNPDLVITIPTEPLDFKAGTGVYETPDIFNIAERSIQTMIDEIFNSDIRSFQRINRMLKEAHQQGAQLHKENEEPYQYYESLMLAPDKKLGGALNSNPASLRARYQHGYNWGHEQIEKFKGTL